MSRRNSPASTCTGPQGEILRDHLVVPMWIIAGLSGHEAIAVVAVPAGEPESQTPRVAVSAIHEDPATWGLVLADLVEHLANAYEDRGWDRQVALQRILGIFAAERARPTVRIHRVTPEPGRS